jgi:tetratricopeptide (TPR) repeat protein
MAITLLAALFTLSLAETAAAAGRGNAPWVGESLSGKACAWSDPGNFGPFDYNIDKDKLPVVENHHFTREVEQLQKGSTAPYPIGDVSYTLVKFPNHPRALYSVIRFSLSTAPKANWEKRFPPAECYLQRAINYSPTDSTPYMLYGLYMHRLGNLEESLAMYKRAEKLAPNDINLAYNMGLLLYDAELYDESYQYAKKAYDGGMNPPGLKRKLDEKGYWKQ